MHGRYKTKARLQCGGFIGTYTDFILQGKNRETTRSIKTMAVYLYIYDDDVLVHAVKYSTSAETCAASSGGASPILALKPPASSTWKSRTTRPPFRSPVRMQGMKKDIYMEARDENR